MDYATIGNRDCFYSGKMVDSVVKIFGKDVQIFTERLGPGKVQAMKEKNTGLP